MKILITGATGLIGGEIAKALLESGKIERLWVLARKKSHPLHFHEIFDDPQVQRVEGDLANPELFNDFELGQQIKQQVDTIIHAAALYDLFAQRADHYLTNVVGTQNLLFFANDCSHLKTFHFLSSIAVAGDTKGILKEDQLDIGQKFTNPYGETKFESEFHVRRALPKVKKRIYRPGAVIGHSQTGQISKRDGPYYFFKFLKKLKKVDTLLKFLPALPLPFHPETILPLIPIDHLGELVVKEILQAQHSDSELDCFHLFSPDSPFVQDFVNEALKLYHLEKIKIIPISRNATKMLKKMTIIDQLGIPRQSFDYLYGQTVFDQTRTLELMPRLADSLYQNYRQSFYSL